MTRWAAPAMWWPAPSWRSPTTSASWAPDPAVASGSCPCQRTSQGPPSCRARWYHLNIFSSFVTFVKTYLGWAYSVLERLILLKNLLKYVGGTFWVGFCYFAITDKTCSFYLKKHNALKHTKKNNVKNLKDFLWTFHIIDDRSNSYAFCSNKECARESSTLCKLSFLYLVSLDFFARLAVQ